MKHMSASFLFTAMTLTLSHVHAQSVSPDSLQVPKTAKFDTRYNSTDPKIVVFDDGQQTYVALPKEMTNPIVMSTVPSGEMLLQPMQMSPYLLLPGVHKKLKFLWGNARDVLVVHTGTSGVERNGAAAAFGAVAPVAVHGAIATPVLTDLKKQTVTDLVATKSEQKVAAEQRDLPAARLSVETTLPVGTKTDVTTVQVDAPLATTTKPEVIADPSAKQPANIKTWNILPTDGRLATSLERWAKSEGMRLIWDAKKHVMLSSSDSFTGTLSEALQRVLSSPAIRQSDYPLEACIYPNNPPVLRITRLTEQAQECPQ